MAAGGACAATGTGAACTWADAGGGRPISAAEREEGVAEAITELNEGEPL